MERKKLNVPIKGGDKEDGTSKQKVRLLQAVYGIHRILALTFQPGRVDQNKRQKEVVG